MRESSVRVLQRSVPLIMSIVKGLLNVGSARLRLSTCFHAFVAVDLQDKGFASFGKTGMLNGRFAVLSVEVMRWRAIHISELVSFI